MAYCRYLHSRRWQELRAEALVRDGCRCRSCNSAQDLEVHHRRYPAVFGTETVDDLTTLCRSCHEAISAHLDRRRFREREPLLIDAQRLVPPRGEQRSLWLTAS